MNGNIFQTKPAKGKYTDVHLAGGTLVSLTEGSVTVHVAGKNEEGEDVVLQTIKFDLKVEDLPPDFGRKGQHIVLTPDLEYHVETVP